MDSKFDSGHYSYVFIDEAGCAQEPISLIPIAGTGQTFLFSHFQIWIQESYTFFIYLFIPRFKKKIGLCTEPGDVKTSIILSGDPHQLIPITKSKYAADLGYKTSLMVHLLTKPRYNENKHTGKYDSRYIVHLVENYRNHPDILEIPNKLFYRGMLEAKAPSKRMKLGNVFLLCYLNFVLF